MNARQITRVVAAFALLASTLVISSPAPVSAHHGAQYILCLQNCSQWTRFTNYDYRQSGWGSVDWPTGFYFKFNATINGVKNGICNTTTHPWKYCTGGGTQYMYVEQVFSLPAATPARWSGFDADGGRKRFNQSCTNNNYTAHIRLYAPPTQDAFYDLTNGFQIAGSAHLDYRDSNGCSGRIHGYTETGENWMIGTMTSIPGWSVSYNVSGFLNANATHTVNRTLGGVQVPHVYENDGLATLVSVP